MHDLEFDHAHMAPGEELNEVAWAADNVELTTVGIDIGSSTSHLMFAQVHLQRLGTALSSRFVVVNRRVIWQSPIMLTPYLPDFTIDTDELASFIGGCYQYADLEPTDIDSGAVILTGEAIKRHNARAIADLFSEEAGRFVCASAGHHMECQMAAHGSGAVALSRGHGATLLNIDIGGGTTKFALIEKGQILATAAIAVGGRLIVEEANKGLVRVEEPAREIASSLGIDLSLGKPLAAADRERIVARMVRLDHAHDRPPRARRAVAAPAGDRCLAAGTRHQGHRRADLLRRRRRISLQAREAKLRRSRLRSRARARATCWRSAATCRRSGTPARASAPPSLGPRSSRCRSAATRSPSASPTNCRCRTFR